MYLHLLNRKISIFPKQNFNYNGMHHLRMNFLIFSYHYSLVGHQIHRLPIFLVGLIIHLFVFSIKILMHLNYVPRSKRLNYVPKVKLFRDERNS